MNRSRRLVFPALIAAGVLWGTTVPLSKLALVWLPPAWLAFTRFGLAAVILMLVSRSRLRGAASPAILISGALGYGGSVLLQNFGIEHTSVTHAALLIGATPVLVAIMAAVCGHGVARPLAWAGFILSLVGVAVIAAGKGGGATLGGDGLVLLSQLASAGFTVSQARLLRDRDPVAVTALQLLAAAVVTLPIALLSGSHAGPAGTVSVLATGALVLAGTVAPTAMFAFAQSRVSADVAGAFLNLEPLVGAAAGTVLFAEPLGPVQLAGGTAILAGIGLSTVQAIRSARPRPAPAGVPAAVPAGMPAAVRAGVPAAVRAGMQAAVPAGVPAVVRAGVRAGMLAAVPAGMPAAVPAGVLAMSAVAGSAESGMASLRPSAGVATVAAAEPVSRGLTGGRGLTVAQGLTVGHGLTVARHHADYGPVQRGPVPRGPVQRGPAPHGPAEHSTAATRGATGHRAAGRAPAGPGPAGRPHPARRKRARLAAASRLG
jgi:O-acetylserine/cysteine efflux transporter